MSENTTENVNESEVNENVETENVNAPVTEESTITPDGEKVPTVNADSEETEETEEPKVFMPKSADEVNSGDGLIDSLMVEIFGNITQITEINTLLARNTDTFKPENLLAMAQTSEDPAVKKMWGQYDRALKAIEKVKSDLFAAVENVLGDEKLSDEEVKAKDELRKEFVESVGHTKKAIMSIAKTKLHKTPEKLAEVEHFVNTISVPGVKTGTASVSEGGASTAPKVRLYGGTVSIKDKNHVNFAGASKHLTELVKKDVTSLDLVNAWTASQNVNTWQDTPLVSEFTFEGVTVHVVRNKEKLKS
jgi:hypothetical protein